MVEKNEEEECSVCVAVNIRPLIGQEVVESCRECVTVTPGQPQVSICEKSFMFDKVYGTCGGHDPDRLFDDCVAPLVDGLFKGYNATVFAYGQTGSGKTYTMGSAFTPGGNIRGVIPSVLGRIFEKVAATPDTEFGVQVSFVEIHKEEIRDLLVFDGERHVISVREVPGGGVCLAGASEIGVKSKEETADLLSAGSLTRATAATGMNAQSSRSHAIFTITVEQKKQLRFANDKLQGSSDDDEGNDPVATEENEQMQEDDPEVVDDYLCAKMHLVDLAGSERMKRTKAVGDRLQEGIDINRGLLALGKVISALVEGQKHIPYRDSKLTRLLQDSLGGNSRTVMIACVSPADINMEETLNTVRYANNARKIKNKPVVNRDPQAAQLAYLRQQLAIARSELIRYKNAARGEGDVGSGNVYLQEALEQVEKERKSLEDELARIYVQLDGAMADVDEAKRCQVEAQCARDGLKMDNQRIRTVLQELQNRGVDMPTMMEDSKMTEGADMVQDYLDKIADLELDNKRLRQLHEFSSECLQRQAMAGANDALPTPRLGGFSSNFTPIPELEDVDAELEHSARAAAEEEAYQLEQDRLSRELEDLQRNINKKEELASRLNQPSEETSNLRAQYEKQLKELESNRSKLDKERTELVMKLQNLKVTTTEDKQRLEEKYRNQLKEKDDKLKELKKKEKYFQKIEKLKSKEEDINRKLKSDIDRMKAQKVQLVRQIDLRVKEYNERLKRTEKEMMQLKKQGRVNAAKLQRIEALHNKQQAVLKRKTEEAEAARKRLKEFVGVAQKAQAEARGKRGPVVDCQPNQAAPLLRDEKSKREWVERELDICNQSWDLKRVLDAEVELRKHASKEVCEIEKRLEHFVNPLLSPKSPHLSEESREKLINRKADLEQRIVYHSQEIAQLQPAWQHAKSEEDSKGGAATDAKRWNGLKGIVEARAMLKTVFKVASDLRAHVNEVYSENVRLGEESGMMQTRIDELKQEVQVARMGAARAEAAAVTAATLTARQSAKPEIAEEEKSNLEVEKFLQELATVSKGRESSANPAHASDDDTSGDESDAMDEDEEVTTQNVIVNSEMTLAEEQLLAVINNKRRLRGEAMALRLTVKVLEQELRIGNPNWVRGSKSKDAVISDYKEMLEEANMDLDSPMDDITPRKSEKTRAFLKKREEMLSTIERAKSGGGVTARRSTTFGSRQSSSDLQPNGSGRFSASRHDSFEGQAEMARFASLAHGLDSNGINLHGSDSSPNPPLGPQAHQEVANHIGYTP